MFITLCGFSLFLPQSEADKTSPTVLDSMIVSPPGQRQIQFSWNSPPLSFCVPEENFIAKVPYHTRGTAGTKGNCVCLSLLCCCHAGQRSIWQTCLKTYENTGIIDREHGRERKHSNQIRRHAEKTSRHIVELRVGRLNQKDLSAFWIRTLVTFSTGEKLHGDGCMERFPPNLIGNIGVNRKTTNVMSSVPGDFPNNASLNRHTESMHDEKRPGRLNRC